MNIGAGASKRGRRWLIRLDNGVGLISKGDGGNLPSDPDQRRFIGTEWSDPTGRSPGCEDSSRPQQRAYRCQVTNPCPSAAKGDGGN